MSLAIRLKDVTRVFPEFRLGPLNMELDLGVALGYLGPNGSGKSTTMHCLMGLMEATSGEIEILGSRTDPRRSEWKQNIGYVGDVHVFHERWTVEQNLHWRSRYYQNWSEKSALELAKRFQLPLGRRAKELSSGNRVKLSLVQAMAHRPKLLLLDEPTAGIDPVVRGEVVDALFEILEAGESALLYATHVIGDIDRLADELAFLDNGEIVLRSSKEDLNDNWRKLSFRMTQTHMDFQDAVEVKREGADYYIVSSNHQATLAQLKELGAGEIRMNRMELEEIAVQIMKSGRSLGERR